MAAPIPRGGASASGDRERDLIPAQFQTMEPFNLVGEKGYRFGKGTALSAGFKVCD